MRRTVQILASLLLSLGWWPVASWAQEPVLDAANAFITRWKGADKIPIQVPLYGTYAYRWEKADGTVVKSGVVTVQENKVLDLPVAENGEYVLKAGPAGVKRIEFGKRRESRFIGYRGTPWALKEVSQWGSVAWVSFVGAFYGCENMNIAEGAGKPDLSGVMYMESVFEGCVSFNSPIGAWDVSKVKNMKRMFAGCSSFNQPLEGWDVSKVENMWEIFSGCSSFDQPLGGWTLASFNNPKIIEFEGTNLSVANYSSTLAAWVAKRDKLSSRVIVHARGCIFDLAGQAARRQLIEEKRWTFYNDELAVPVEPLDPVKAFITRWNGTAGERIYVPLSGHYSYEWVRSADGSVVVSGEAHVSPLRMLTLEVPAGGEYVLKAGPAGVKRIEFGIYSGSSYGSRGTPRALLGVEQWGSVKWGNFEGAFYGCENMNIAEGAGSPDLSGVTLMRLAFGGCKSFNSPIGDWDMSEVTNMEDMFKGCSSFDQPLGGWTLASLDYRYINFIDTKLSVANYSSTLEAWAAKRDHLKSDVTVYAEGLFYNDAGGAARQLLIDTKGWSFKNDFPEFDPSNAFVTRWWGTVGKKIQVPLYGHYGYRWEKADGTVVKSGVVTVTDGQLLEFPVEESEEYVLKAGPTGVKRIEFGISSGNNYNASRGTPKVLLQVSQWGGVKWESLAGAFYGCENMIISEGAGRPDLNRVKSMRYAFKGCSKFDAPIGNWDVSRVADMEAMFLDCSSFNQSLGGWTLSGLTGSLGLDNSKLSVENYSQTLEAWAGQRDQLKKGVRVRADGLFYNVAGGAARQLLIEEQEWTFFGDHGVLDPSNAFVTRWQGKKGANIAVPLYGHYKYRWEKADGTEVISGEARVGEGGLLELPVAEAGEYVLMAGPSGVARIEFGISSGSNYNASRGTPRALLQVVQWGSVAWESFAGAFYGCTNMNVADDAGKLDLRGVASMHSAFGSCTSFNPSIGDWDVSNVTNMLGMFYGCSAFNQPLEQWDVSRVESMRGMFEGCSAFNQPLEGWDVSQVKHMGWMFTGCSAFNQPLEKWNVAKVENMERMFVGCSAFNQPLGSWKVASLRSNLGLGYSNLSIGNYSSTLEAWAEKRYMLQNGVRVNAQDLFYNAAGKKARQILKEDKGWVFGGDREVTVDDPVVDIVDAPSQLYVGDTYTFRAKVEPAEVSQEVTWSVREGDGWGTFSGNVLTANRVGTITVKATALADPQPSRIVRVEVIPVSLTSITVSPRSARLGVGGTQALRVGCVPENATNKSVTWSSSDEEVATVDWKGIVTGWKEGAATITATSEDGGHTATCAVTVTAPVALTGITVSPVSAQLEIGGTQTLTVGYTPADATNRAVMWTSDNESVATVDAAGVVTARGKGTATITATAADGGYTATCAVTVEASPVALTGITVKPTSVRLGIGSTQTLTVSYTPEDATNKSVTWSSSDASVATVDAAGVVTAKGKGSATITATAADGGHTASCAVEVTAPVALTGIAVSPAGMRLKAGEMQQLTVGYTPENATNRAVTWSSSDEDVATVDAAGVVTAKGEGSATITVKADDGGHTATCAVTVTAPVTLTGITVSPTRARIAIGGTQTLTVGYTPADATNKAVTWSSSDEDVATVDVEGLVTAKGRGIAKITATADDGGHTASCEVTVVAPVALTGIAVNPTRARIAIGDTQALAVGYTPADATNKAVTWSSSDEDVATVDAQGVVTAKGEGTATITATSADGGHTASCAVTVVAPVALTGITVMPTSAQLKVGLTQQLALGYTPADATNKRVMWASSDKGVATVDAQGKVTGVKAGSATITVTSVDGGHTATCSVTVVADEKPSGVESVALAGVSVSPNPFGDHLTVRGAEGVQRYALVNGSGVVVLEGAHDGASELRLETGRLAAGMYWLRLEATDGERVVQVVKR